jgi:hypothetical protein
MTSVGKKQTFWVVDSRICQSETVRGKITLTARVASGSIYVALQFIPLQS